jgi:hypothetical protein
MGRHRGGEQADVRFAQLLILMIQPGLKVVLL